MPFVDVIIYSFHYLLDPKVAEQVSKEMSKDAIVVFDEAHNIDNVCIESLSIDLTRPMLDSAGRSINKLGDKIEEYVAPRTNSNALNRITRIKITDASKLQDEYARLVNGLQDPNEDDAEDGFMSNPRKWAFYLLLPTFTVSIFIVLPDDLLNEAVPGNIRKAEHFVAFLKRFVEYLKVVNLHIRFEARAYI
jgi:DNA excision repair protein ERCC-2